MSIKVLQHWAQVWDLQLDKTVVWSTCARARAFLRQQGLRVVLDGLDLGGHMQYALRRTNYGFVARISSFEPAWLRLPGGIPTQAHGHPHGWLACYSPWQFHRPRRCEAF